MMNKEYENTDEEKSNTDKLLFYWQEEVRVHIVLKQKLFSGQNKFINCLILNRLSDRLWKVKDFIGKEIEISISDIAPWGVDEYEVEEK